MQWQSVTACYKCLVASVIVRAITDLKETNYRGWRIEKDRAMVFLMSDICEEYCLELGIDYETVREKAAALYGTAPEPKRRNKRKLRKTQTKRESAPETRQRQSSSVLGHFREGLRRLKNSPYFEISIFTVPHLGQAKERFNSLLGKPVIVSFISSVM
jgi:hypothetical protein